MKMNDYERRWDNVNRRWIYRHREVMETILNRPLRSDEHVHHRDGDPKNNQPSNLQLVSAAEHARIHSPARRAISRRCDLIGCGGVHHARGLCKKHYMQKFRPSRAKKRFAGSNPALTT